METLKNNINLGVLIFCAVVIVGLTLINVNGADAIVYIEDYFIDPGINSISIPVSINITNSSVYLGSFQMSVLYNSSILNATNHAKVTVDTLTGCTYLNGNINCNGYNTNEYSGDYDLFTINFSINTSLVGVKSILKISIDELKDLGGNSINYALQNGSLQINCTNDSQCVGNKICNQSTHLCQATTITCYRDADNDTYGNATNTIQNTTCPSGYVNNISGGSDCNDYNNTIKPGAIESYNGVDDNCNGQIDEGFCNTSANCSSSQFCNTTHKCEAKKSDGLSCSE